MLEEIETPDHVKSLNQAETKQLCRELRERIIEVTSRNGGHIAPSLGVVELTVALLQIFDPLQNRMIWDVGHQSYPFKILTGRNKNFETLRQFGGISGFNKISESKYDAFGVGHSSTSISAGLGIYTGKELKGEPQKTLAIIGDGAISSGEAFEGLNNLGGMHKNLIVILNDNKMSISRNVGGLHYYLADILSGRPYNKIKEELWRRVQVFPKKFRKRLISLVRHIEGLKSVLIPNGFFEDIGFKYYGPIDGHNVQALNKIFSNVKNNVTGPVLIHVITKKGKGFEYAEDDATKFHGISPFDEKTGEVESKTSKSKKKKYSHIFAETLTKIADEDDMITATTAAMTEGTGLSHFNNNHPDRFFDVGISEQHAVTFNAGLALEGVKPFVAIYSTFLQRAYDQIIHDVALQNLPVRFAIDRGGLVGADGPTHHGTFDLSYLTCIPNLTILAPRDGNELKKMIKYMAKYDKGPIAVRYPRGEAKSYNELGSPRLGYGKSEVVFSGNDTAIISIGTAFDKAYLAYKKLQDHKIDAYLINARFAKPIDKKLIKKLHDQGVRHIVTVEHNVRSGGFGSQVLQTINDLDLDIKIKIFAIPDRFISHGKTDTLYEKINLTGDNIFEYVLNYYG